MVISINNSDLNKWAYIRVGLYSGGLIFEGAYIRGGSYIWNEVSISTCGGLIHGGGVAYTQGGLIFGGLR